METICMKCQIPFSGKNKKNIINLLSAELAQRVLKIYNCMIMESWWKNNGIFNFEIETFIYFLLLAGDLDLYTVEL